MPKSVERKLAAIVSADVVGFSRLMGADETGTLAALKAHRNAIDPVIFNYGGRIVKTSGDGLLLDYPTVIAAVNSCLEMQKVMAERNATLPVERRMQIRIGVHLGEIMVDGDDIFGDVVNIAARLQAAADPGGIALSGACRDAVHRHIDSGLVDLGAQKLKNIAEPVALWRVDMGDTEQAGLEAAAARGKAERSAVAVLPFDNMSSEPEQDYFADGITEDIITALSVVPDIKVIARNSTFSYKGMARDVRLIAAELDARYVLEGSVRKAGNRVRITSQLVDATNGQHLWAERFDRDLKDVFELQDEITGSIAACVAPTLIRSEMERARQRHTTDLDVWDAYLRILYHYYRPTIEDYAAALDLCRNLQSKDLDFGPAYYMSAAITMNGGISGRLVKLSSEVWRKMLQDSEKGAALAPDDFRAHANLSNAYAFSGNYEGAMFHGQRALQLNPHAPLARFCMGLAHWINGEHELALRENEEGWRRGANDPDRYHGAAIAAFSSYQLRRYEAAISWSSQCLKLMPHHVQALGCKAAALAALDRCEEAQAVLAVFQERVPRTTVDFHLRNFKWKLDADIAHYREGLIKAGMPEH